MQPTNAVILNIAFQVTLHENRQYHLQLFLLVIFIKTM